MNKSEQIDALAAAFAKAQGQFKAVKRSGKNPALHNDYITLDDIINSVRPILAANGLAYTQLLHGKNGTVRLTTMLIHESGQWIDSTVVVEAGEGNRAVNTTQALGSSITYMKRYALSAMLGIAAETDDDGNGASQEKKQPAATSQTRGPSWEAAQQTSGGSRPYDAETLRAKLHEAAGWQDGSRLEDGEPITTGQVSAVSGLMTDAVKQAGFNQAAIDKLRHEVLDYLLGVRLTSNLTKREASAIITAWKHKDKDVWDANSYARPEAAAILNAAQVEAGQTELPM